MNRCRRMKGRKNTLVQMVYGWLPEVHCWFGDWWNRNLLWYNVCTDEQGVIFAIVCNIMGITAVIYEFVGGIWNGETQMTVGDSVRKFEGRQTFLQYCKVNLLQLFVFYHHKCGVLCVEMETT